MHEIQIIFVVIKNEMCQHTYVNNPNHFSGELKKSTPVETRLIAVSPVIIQGEGKVGVYVVWKVVNGTLHDPHGMLKHWICLMYAL